MFIQAMPEDPIVKNTASQNKLYLGFVCEEGFVVTILNLFFKAPKALSTVTLREECLKLKSSLWFCGLFKPNSLK